MATLNFISAGAVSAPVNSVAPAVTGTETEGQTLSCTTGTWSGSPSYAYQWKRDGSNIGGATSSTYLLDAADVGADIHCTVTATNAGGSVAADSNTVGPIAAASPPGAIDPYYDAGSRSDNVFSGYSQIIADTTFVGTDGNSTTVSWNGGTLNAPTYKTLQAALTAGSGASKRICLLAGQTWTVGTDTYLTMTAGGTSDSARCVVMGDPAASAGTMPVIDFNNAGGAFNPVRNDNACQYLTVRGIKFYRSPYSMISMYPNGVGTQAIDGLVVEFCIFDTMISSDNSGGVGLNNISHTFATGPAIRYNYFLHIYQSGQSNGKAGFFNQGAVYVEGTPGGYFHHNEVNDCTTSIYHKNASGSGSTGSPNGWIHAYNIVRSGTCGYRFGGAGATTNAVFGAEVHHDLFYDITTNPIKFEIGSTTPQCDVLKIYNITTGQDVSDGPHIENMHGIEVYNCLFLHDSGGWGFHSQTSARTTKFTKIDYNAYKFYAWYLNRSGSPSYEYTSLASWRTSNTDDSPADFSTLIAADPDANCLNVALGRVLANSDVNNTGTRDYSPVLADLLTDGEGGSYVGCYSANTIAGSELVGRGWT